MKRHPLKNKMTKFGISLATPKTISTSIHDRQSKENDEKVRRSVSRKLGRKSSMKSLENERIKKKIEKHSVKKQKIEDSAQKILSSIASLEQEYERMQKKISRSKYNLSPHSEHRRKQNNQSFDGVNHILSRCIPKSKINLMTEEIQSPPRERYERGYRMNSQESSFSIESNRKQCLKKELYSLSNSKMNTKNPHRCQDRPSLYALEVISIGHSSQINHDASKVSIGRYLSKNKKKGIKVVSSSSSHKIFTPFNDNHNRNGVVRNHLTRSCAFVS